MKVFVDAALLEKSSGKVSHAFRIAARSFEASVIFTTRSGGFSREPYSSLNLSFYVGDDRERVERNRQAVSRLLGVSDFITVDQAHGKDVAVIRKCGSENPVLGHMNLKADALVTDLESVPLGVLAADCLPVIVVAEPGIVSAIHAGWRGIYEGVLESAFGKMLEMRGENFVVFFGPSICRDCYEVKEDVVDKFRKKFSTGVVSQGGKWHLCLKTLAFEVLERMGIAKHIVNIKQLSSRELTGCKMVYNIDVCTFENKIYYSYRREGLTGRQAGIVFFRRR